MTTPTIDIVHITDCHDTNPEGGFLAATKVKLAYSAHARRLERPASIIEVLPAEEFNTIDVGAKFSEVATSAVQPENLVVAINAAPPSIPGGNGNNERRNFVLGRLKNGVVFGGTWGGHCLSYVKSQITELHELLDSNNGSQFRSLEVLPGALSEFAAGKINPARLASVDFARAVPEIPGQSHAWTIDNFGNIKLALSGNDLRAVNDAFGEYETRRNRPARSDHDRRSDVTQPTVRFAFGRHSVEFGARNEPYDGAFNEAIIDRRLFSPEEGTTVLTLTSSAKRWDNTGNVLPVPQIATLRREPGRPRGYELPRIGAPLFLRLSGGTAPV